MSTLTASMDETTKEILGQAAEEARRLNHNYIGTEHILLGILRVPCEAQEILTRHGVQLTMIRDATEFIIGRGDNTTLNPTYTPRSKKVIELSLDEARRQGSGEIKPHHLLIGLIREGEGIGAGILESVGINLERLRQVASQVVVP